MLCLNTYNNLSIFLFIFFFCLFQSGDGGRPRFISVTSLEDSQVVRAVAVHPTQDLYAVGSNSKLLRICAFPQVAGLR